MKIDTLSNKKANLHGEIHGVVETKELIYIMT